MPSVVGTITKGAVFSCIVGVADVGPNKVDATAAPTAGDDSADGYVVGSVWIDVSADKAYVCVDNSAGFAIWKQVGGSGLDADTVDGSHAAAFATSAHVHAVYASAQHLHDNSPAVYATSVHYHSAYSSAQHLHDNSPAVYATSVHYHATYSSAQHLHDNSPAVYATSGHAHAGGAHNAVTLAAALGSNLLSLTDQELGLNNQNPALFFAGPASGAAAAPNFRAIAAGDVTFLAVVYATLGHTHAAGYTDAQAIAAVENEPTLDVLGKLTVYAGIEADHIDEFTGDHGVVIEGVRLIDSYIELAEIAAPGNPAANKGRFYSADESGTTRLYFKDASGAVTDLTAVHATLGHLHDAAPAIYATSVHYHATYSSAQHLHDNTPAVYATSGHSHAATGGGGATCSTITGTIYAVPAASAVPKRQIGPMPFGGTFLEFTVKSYDVAAQIAALQVDVHKQTAANEDSNTSASIFGTTSFRASFSSGHYAGSSATFPGSPSFNKGDWLSVYVDAIDTGLTVLDFGLEVAPSWPSA